MGDLVSQDGRRSTSRPSHPTGAAVALLVGVTLLIVLLALVSTF